MADSTSSKKPEAEGNYKETVEAILVAFILAFIFRAFVVEAFVIPTGSMAPTLYGAHMRLRCPDCGYSFDIGFHGTTSADGEDIDIPPTSEVTMHYHCPNCGYEFPSSEPGQRVTLPVRFGDRILVLKYLYLFEKPVRWDVVVFKSPDEQQHHVPEDPLYEQNYIKRLVGIGPESVVILDGDVYTGPPEAQTATDKSGKPLFHIQRKAPYAQDALWRVVYDNDFVPHLGKEIHSWTQPWQPDEGQGGWTTQGAPASAWPGGTPARSFAFSNASGESAIHFNADANASMHHLTEYLTYDELDHAHNNPAWEPLYVSDLKLACDYTRKTGDGPVRLQLSKNADLFTAEFTKGQVRLLRGRRISENSAAVSGEREVGVPPGASAPGAASVPALADSAPARIELINVDYRVCVRVNGREVLHTIDDDAQPLISYKPDVQALWQQELRAYAGAPVQPGPYARPIVRIDAARQQAMFEHVILSRDIYYLTHRGREFWASVQKVTHLARGEYFVLGDNSFISGDARYWDTPIDLPHENLQVQSGRVPERFMLGKAFFVYWPAGYPLPWIPVNAVPDFGEMRFIH